MNYRVVFSPQAQDQLVELFRYIAEAASPDRAIRYTDAIVGFCESLRLFPHRGIQRSDIRPGLRITNFKSRVVIAFAVDAGGCHGSVHSGHFLWRSGLRSDPERRRGR